MARYTDEELSRILSAADARGLVRFGVAYAAGLPCCLVQAAKGHAGWFCPQQYWFDHGSTELQRSDPDAMLAALEEQGWA